MKDRRKGDSKSSLDFEKNILEAIFYPSFLAVFSARLFVFPLLSIILGIIYSKKGLNCTKNIVSGGIILFLVFIGLLLPSAKFDQHDCNELYEINSIIETSIPERGKCTVHVYNEKKDGLNRYIYIIGTVNFSNNDSNQFLRDIKSNKNWATHIDDELKKIISTNIPITNDYYMLYNETLGLYNNSTVRNNDTIYCFSYNIHNKILYITKFKIVL